MLLSIVQCIAFGKQYVNPNHKGKTKYGLSRFAPLEPSRQAAIQPDQADYGEFNQAKGSSAIDVRTRLKTPAILPWSGSKDDQIN